jgi:STE24 endopeptidase
MGAELQAQNKAAKPARRMRDKKLFFLESMGNNLLRMDTPLGEGFHASFLMFFLAFFGLGLAVELFLNALNRREALRHASLPPRFTGPPLAGLFDADTFAKARSYTLDRLSFDSFSVLYSAAFTLVLLFSGVLPWVHRLLVRAVGDGSIAAGAGFGGLHQSVLFLAAVTAVQSLSRLPLTIHSTFRIEGRYGFNTMTWDLFWRDLVKGLVLSAVLGVPLLYAVFALMGVFGKAWWLWAFGLMLAFQIIMMVLYPIFIAPLFNRFKPLEDGDLKRDLLELAGRLRFPAGGIFVMDGSRRSLHSNAYFTGFGRFRRIVLFDTLIRQMERPELLSVLAHEIAHYKLKHIYKGMAIQIAMMGALFYVAALALRWPPLYTAFGFDAFSTTGAAGPGSPAFAGSPAAGLFLFMTVFSAVSFLFTPLQNLLSRRHEYQADAYAVSAIRDSAAMQTALIKLSTQNLSNLTPHPWYSAFHYSHPNLAERLGSIEKLHVPLRSEVRD